MYRVANASAVYVSTPVCYDNYFYDRVNNILFRPVCDLRTGKFYYPELHICSENFFCYGENLFGFDYYCSSFDPITGCFLYNPYPTSSHALIGKNCSLEYIHSTISANVTTDLDWIDFYPAVSYVENCL